jgi:hypothetical protein
MDTDPEVQLREDVFVTLTLSDVDAPAPRVALGGVSRR